eukprot:TRINITY_DN7127_c0_g2_i1.p1 TRINITY_DN7127_c0_g2~~TRINITY_DN7127_c0_g2_i1.p1  ORF type:complete len:298 (-),score=9.82 TRINITY_DN7127_c0_g2_i1:47-940(-)
MSCVTWFSDDMEMSSVLPMYNYYQYVVGSLYSLFWIFSVYTLVKSARMGNLSKFNFSGMNIGNILICLTLVTAYVIIPIDVMYCTFPPILTHLFYAVPFMFCLGSYYIVMELWILLGATTLGVSFNYKRYFIFMAVLFLVSTVIFIVSQAIDTYIEFHLGFMGFFSGMVSFVNGMLIKFAVDLRKRTKKMGLSKSLSKMDRNLKVIIIGKLMISVSFVGCVVIVISLGLVYNPISWLVYEVVVHVCLMFAITLELVIFHILLSSKPKSNEKGSVIQSKAINITKSATDKMSSHLENS